MVHADADEEQTPWFAAADPMARHLTAEKRPKKPLRRGMMPAIMDLKTALKELEAAGSESTRKTYARHGIQPPMFGVSFATLGKLKKQIKSDHGLARQLWATGNHDARILATMIADPGMMNEAELESWVATLDNALMADAVAKVAAASSYAMKKMQQWTRSADEWTSSAGWCVLAMMAADRAHADAFFDAYLGRIEKEIASAPNRTRYAMNNALIAIGVRGGSLMTKAISAAKRIGPVEVDHGQTACETPDAVAYIHKTIAHQAGKAKSPKPAKPAARAAKATSKPHGAASKKKTGKSRAAASRA